MGILRTLNNSLLSAVGGFLSVPGHGHCSLMYHSISDSDDIFAVSPESFRQQIDLLLQNKIRFDRFDALSADRRFFVSVTFDDGYLDNLKAAAPILAERKIPFTVFVISDFVKNSAARYLTPADLKELAQIPGASIGSHSKSHVELPKLSLAELQSELQDSKKYLEDCTGQAIRSMSFPFGQYNDNTIAEAKKAGYQFLGTSDYFVNQEDTDLRSRTCIMQEDSLKSVYGKVKGSWNHYKKFRSKLG